MDNIFTFDFAPNSRVAEIIAPEEPDVKDFNGWDYAPRPVLPFRRSFLITLEGMRWYMDSRGRLDLCKNKEYNAGALQEFYSIHRKYKEFYYEHEWLGVIMLRFKAPLNVPKAIPNSNGLTEPIEIQAIHHNPEYSGNV